MQYHRVPEDWKAEPQQLLHILGIVPVVSVIYNSAIAMDAYLRTTPPSG
jgi:hypothetical protein